MSARIEATSSPVGLLRELPAGWAQTIVTSPSRRDLDDSAAAIFVELHRVLRDDGTLWLLCADKDLPGELAECGWTPQPVAWATPLRVDPAGRVRLHLLVKHSNHHYDTHAAGLFLERQTRGALARVAGRRRGCAWGSEHRRQLMRFCVIAATARVACGTCGTAYQRAASGERQPACAHHNPRGRCLVLDPFYSCAHGTHDAALQGGCSFLGIVDTTAGGDPQ